MLVRAVGVQKFAADIDYLFAVPVHYEARLSLDLGNGDSLKIFAVCKREEFFHVMRLDNYGHPLLAFAYRKLRAVKAVIFLRHGVEVNFKPVGELADGDRHAARTEVVAALYHQAGLFISEQPLEFSLLGRVALLHLCAAALKGVYRVRFRRARGSAAAVTAGRAAEQDDYISGSGDFTAHVLGRSRRDNCADLHSLCRIAGMIYLVNNAGRKADLVAVGGVARGGGGDYLSLRKLALYCLIYGLQRIRGARDAHCAVDV